MRAARLRARRWRLGRRAERAGTRHARRRGRDHRAGDSAARRRPGAAGRVRLVSGPAPLAAATAVRPLTREAVAGVDERGMLAAILAQPMHLHDAVRRARTTELSSGRAPREVLVCGMGGSAIGGELAAAVLAGGARSQLRTLRDYELDSWAGDGTLAICASYSGNTEETLSCYAGAGAAGAQRVAVTAGGELQRLALADGVPVMSVPTGLQPRAAVCYMLVAVLHCAARSGIAPDPIADISRVSLALA